MNTPAWTLDRITELLRGNPEAVYRAVLAVYSRQTSEEKTSGLALAANGVGFSANDSHYLTKVAKRLQAGQAIPAVEFPFVQERIMRYRRQLLVIALANQIEQHLIDMTESK